MLYDIILDKKFVSGNLEGLTYDNDRIKNMTKRYVDETINAMNKGTVIKGLGGSDYIITNVRVKNSAHV